ncbi:hypothetical protein WMF04_02075 [Sorangium sp. So ce260]|uniref:hypothetical protein n=1 Tax=Sorangium sp. So ce260 TaxID=3133291 RepID=UPI003F5FC374
MTDLRPLRILGILLCGGLLVAPTVASYHERLQPIALDVIRALFPLWIGMLIQLSIDERCARERAARERERAAREGRGE